ncbi:MAG: hypothetical protein KF773_24840 [Deltaproteobacteria bacterium]|nr:hypothetical protein [Deltaproteobacteria bacterium]
MPISRRPCLYTRELLCVSGVRSGSVRSIRKNRLARRHYNSLDEAHEAFDAYAGLEPRLASLWDDCQRIAPPVPEPVEIYDSDPYEVDLIAADKPTDGWSAEDAFCREVKSKLLPLVGRDRRDGPDELRTDDAYLTVLDLLLNWALPGTGDAPVVAVDHEPAAERGERGDGGDRDDCGNAGAPAHW